MATAYTSLLGLALPVTGELSGTWGSTVNTEITALLDSAIAGTTTLSTDADVTLTTTTGAANTSRQAILLCSGARTVLRTITAPAQSKIYTIINATTGGFSVKLVGAGPTTGLTIPNGASAVVAWNGSDFIEIGSATVGNFTVNGTLTVTGVATFSAGTAALPAITTTGDTNTGIFFPAADTIAFSEGGVEAARIDSSGTFRVKGAGTAGSTDAFQVAGTAPASAMVLNSSGNLYLGAISSALANENILTGGQGGGIQLIRNASASPTSGQSLGSYAWKGTDSANSNAAAEAMIEAVAAENFSGVAAGTNMLFYTKAIGTGPGSSPSERMRIDSSGNLGVGTSSPGAKLDVAGNIFATGFGRFAGSLGFFGKASDLVSGGSATDTGLRYDGNNLVFSYSNTERMRLDSSGNLGLGVTPSAWSSASRPALQLTNGAALFSRNGSTFLSQNFFYNAGDTGTYIANGFATVYDQTSGQHQWYNAPSGTANNTAALTQAMTLDASGNLGIGTSSPSSRLEIIGVNPKLTINANDAVNGRTATLSLISGASADPISTCQIMYGAINSTSSGTLTFVEGDGTERMRIDPSGNVGVGTSSPSYKLHVRGADATAVLVVGNTSEGTQLEVLTYQDDKVVLRSNDTSNVARTLAFETGTTERARIDTSGNLLVGATSQPISSVSSRLIVSYATNDYAIGIRQTGAAPYGMIINYSTTVNNTGNEFIVANDSTATRFTVRSNGGIANFSANDANLSDRREKTNFAPAKSYLDVICAIPVQTFNYIDQNMEEDGGLTLGVVAQDVQAVAPELVMESDWGTKEESKMRLSIYQTDLQYALMKCIQEQQALITQLTARLDAANL